MHLEEQPVSWITLLITSVLTTAISNTVYLNSTIESFELVLTCTVLLGGLMIIIVLIGLLWIMGDETKMFGVW